MRVQLTHLIDGQAYVGYIQQDYKALNDIGGVDFGASLHWSATRLTDVKLEVDRSIEETDEVGAVGYFATAVSLNVAHQISRSVTLSANADYTNNDYKGVVRNEDVYGGGLSLDYHFRPQVHLIVDYQYTTRDSNIPGTDYSQNVVEARLRLAL